MKSKIPFQNKRIFGIILLVVALTFFFITLIRHGEGIISEELYKLSYAPSKSSDAKEIWLENNIEYRSAVEFEQYGWLTGVTVWLKKVPSDFTGELVLRIYDKDGIEKESAYISNTDLLENLSDYVWIGDLKVPVSAGEKLWMSWMITGNKGGETCLYIYDNQNGEVIIDEEKSEGESLQQNCYMYISYRWTVILAILISIAVLFVICFEGAVAEKVRGCAVAFLPLLILFLWLEANNNLGFLHSVEILPELTVLYLFLGLFLCAFRLRVGGSFYLLMGLVATVGNYYMQSFRAQPLLITDIFSMYTALHVANNYTYTITFPMISIVMIYVAMLILISTYTCSNGCMADDLCIDKGSEKIDRADKENQQSECCKEKKIKKLFLRFGGGILCLAAYVGVSKNTSFYISSWDVNGAITEHGWLMTNTVLAKICLNNKPEGYAKDHTIEFITETGRDIADEATVIMPENLIVIMDESFSDLSALGDIETDEAVMPFFDSLENGRRIEKGLLGVHVLGGGTISTEWEFLTGGNTGLMNIGSLYPYTLLQNKANQLNYEGICSSLSDVGYRTIAMHPNLATNYGRQSVYPLLGFQKFYSTDNYYADADYVRSFVSEESDFDGIIAQYENKESDNLFVFNVTIQNHGGYSDPLDEYDVTASNIDCDELDVYLTLIHKTDQALKSLIEYFSEVDEPTMIVFFGDHQPSLPDDFYNDIYGTSERSDEQEEKRYVTPYLIWSNYDRMTYDEPYINAGYLEAIVKSEIGLELNQWDRYLLGIMEEYPVVGQYGLFDDDYTFTSYSNLNEKQSEDLKQMQHAMYYWWTHH